MTPGIALGGEKQPGIRFHRKAQIQEGKTLEAIQFAKEVKEYFNVNYPEVLVSLYIEKSGTAIIVHWFADYKDQATYNRLVPQIAKDEKYLALVSKARDLGLFLWESLHDTSLTSITAFKLEKPVADLSQGQEGKIFFTSENLGTFRKILSGVGQSTPVTISGTLKMPKEVNGKVPAVIMLHGVGGVNAHYFEVADMLNEMGIAAFVVDSFEQRGMQLGVDFWKKFFHSYSIRISDAYAALELLSTHPKIDKRRIAVIGYSHGAGVALFVASEKICRSFIADDLRFAASIAYYPLCTTQFKNIDFTNAPILMLLAEKDNMCPIEFCLEYAQRIRDSGADIKVIVYKGAHHQFPVLSGNELIKIPLLRDLSQCKKEELLVLLQDDGAWYYPPWNKTMDEVEERPSCGVDGEAIVAGNKEAKIASIKEYQNLLRKVFNLQ
jgi:dienelactone hydrolase